MTEPPKAVFLSYASQDAAAARGICESLRAVGIEVWFDADGGLEHGDEWDAKIRRQIKECVLFLPVISANTQAREEGYFRLEWDLAAERARTIASGVPFLLPVVIDDTREPEALVPDRFRMVQWTRLRGGEMTPEIQQRLLRLWSQRAAPPAARGGSTSTPPISLPAPGPAPSNRARWPWVVGLAAAVVALGLGGFLALRPGAPPAVPPAAAKVSAPPPPALSPRYAASRPEVAALLTRVQALTDKADVARAELETALSLLDQAARLEPADANVWAERALVELRYVTENLDHSPARTDAALQHAKQAISLDPKNPNARLADARLQLFSASNQAGRDAADAIFEALVSENSDRVDAYFGVAASRFRKRKVDDGLAVLAQAARIPGAAGRVALHRAVYLFMTSDWNRVDAALDEAIALEQSSVALLYKSYVATFWLGDIAQARKAIAAIPAGSLTEDFPASGKLYVALWAHDWDGAIATLRAIPRNYLGSGALSGPTGYYIGYALDRAGRKNAAEIEWRPALEVVNQRLAENPRNPTLFAMKALLQAALGDRAAGEKTLQTLRELHPTSWDKGWPGHILAMTLLPPEEAIDLVARESKAGMNSATYGSLKLDPFLDHLRPHPKFIALLAKAEADPRLNPHAARPAGKPDPKR